MILKQIRVETSSDIVTNSYIVCDNEEAMVIDPGGEPEKILDMLEALNVKPKYIFLTHCHADHIAGTLKIKDNVGGNILISRVDADGLKDCNRNLGPYIGMDVPEMEADSRIDNNDLIHVGDLEFKVIETPGHTNGGVCLYCEKEKLLFSGDTMFAGAWGRTDLPTGSFTEIMNSITNKLMILPEETMVYPGHGRPTTIKDEKNIYINLQEPDM